MTLVTVMLQELRPRGKGLNHIKDGLPYSQMSLHLTAENCKRYMRIGNRYVGYISTELGIMMSKR